VSILIRLLLTTLIVLAPVRAAAQPASGQDAPDSSDAARSADPVDGGGQPSGPDPDRLLNPSQPDYTLIALPTTLRVPPRGSAFRVTHRFTRPLTEGSFGSLLENAFGLDGGALIGLEYRRAVRRGLQAGIHRTSDRTIQFFGVQSIRHEREGAPLGIAALVSIDGTNNFRDEYRPALGVVVSRELGDHGAVYVQPIWVANTNVLPADLADSNHTFMAGLSARLRVRPTIYLVAEATPRVAGFRPGVTQMAVALEKRAGGHAFQISASNGFGTTMGQLAGGARSYDEWYLGFNISRKFNR
jgi:hypothetical protein